MKEIKPTNNSKLKIIVDDEDYPLLSRFNWYVSDTGYAMTQITGQKHVRMHSLIYGAMPRSKLVIDHKNRDKLDNRKENLRAVTQADNIKNREARGICFDKSRNKWVVRYHNKFYGRYNTVREAEKAYRKAKSGVVYEPKRRLHPLLPKNIHKQAGKYGWNVVINGVRYRKNGFSTIAEAQNDFEIKLRELRG